MDFLYLSHCNLYTYELFFLLSHIVFCHWISQQSPWLFILPLFCPYSFSESNNMAQWAGKLKYTALLKAKTVLMPMCDNWNSWLSNYSCLYHKSSGKTERRNESCCSSSLQEDEAAFLQIWFPGFRSPCLKILRPRGNSEHLPFRFPCCSMHHPQCICVSVTMVTLGTVYFLMLTHHSVPRTQGKCNLWCLRYTGVALRDLTSSASMTMPMDGPTP